MTTLLPSIADVDLHAAYRRARVPGALATTLTIMRELDLRNDPVGSQRDAVDRRLLDAGYVYLQIDSHNVWRSRTEIPR